MIRRQTFNIALWMFFFFFIKISIKKLLIIPLEVKLFQVSKLCSLPQLFTRMIADRAPAVKSLQETGEEVLKSADEETKARIEEGLENVTRQWEELNNMTDTRKNALDAAMEAAVSFDALLNDANKKITAAEEELQAQQLGQKVEPASILEEAKTLQVRNPNRLLSDVERV